jgi:hypothetical protein
MKPFIFVFSFSEKALPVWVVPFRRGCGKSVADAKLHVHQGQLGSTVRVFEDIG